MLNQKQLKTLLHYCPETGIFTRIKTVNYNAKAGETLKTVDLSHGYIRASIQGKKYYAHRLVFLWYGIEIPKGYEVDHINGVRHDNRYCNLRLVEKKEQRKNMRKYRNNTSGVMGVYFYKPYKKWMAIISINKKQEFLGYFSDWFDAVCARKSAEIRQEFHQNHGR